MKKLIGILTATLLLTLTGCKTIPMPDYSNQPLASYGGTKNTLQDVEKSIVQAAVSLGWQTKIIEDGKISATLNIRKHQLIVLITYDTESVSVNYVDSENLKYNGESIHRQYANWITNLLRKINANHLTR